jgi:hypothetical protein
VIADFEQRFADVLGARLPAPFGGRVVVAPGAAAATPLVTIGVRHFDRIDEAFGAPPERVPGSADPRRVARLRCQVGLTIVGAADRATALRGVDDVLYAVDAADFRNGSALRVDAGDPGFLIDALVLDSGDLAPDGGQATPSEVAVTAQGWFWPRGTPGETGVVIGEVRVRGAVLPIELTPSPGVIAVGAPAQELTLRVRPAGLLRLGGAAPLPFGQVVLQLFAPGQRPGAGTLDGGAAAAAAGSRLLTLADGAASFRYLPPATAARDELVVALDDGAGGPGVELGRFTLAVKAP